MTAKVRVIPATSVFLNVLGDDTMESIPENMMEAAEIRKTQLYTTEILYHISGFLASLLPHFIPGFHLSYRKVNFIMV